MDGQSAIKDRPIDSNIYIAYQTSSYRVAVFVEHVAGARHERLTGGQVLRHLSIHVRVLDGLLDAQLGEALDLVLQSHIELDVLILHLGGV
jgi:hypothetical protein